MGFSASWCEMYRRLRTPHVALASAGQPGQFSAVSLGAVSCEHGAERSCSAASEHRQEPHAASEQRRQRRQRSSTARGSTTTCSGPGPATSSSAADTNLETKRGKRWEGTRGTEQENVPQRGVCGNYVTSSEEAQKFRACSMRTKAMESALLSKTTFCELGPSCNRQHVCIGCGGARGYGHCQCLQSRLAALA